MPRMDTEFWAAQWKAGRINFHEGRTNVFLERHAAHLKGGGRPRHVLVPLCGKTEDLAFLAAEGHRVTGIEVIEDAVKAFFAERDLVPAVSERTGRVRAYTSGAITILAGDVFDCTAELVGAVDALYDRAALVALPPDVRRRYAAHLRALLAPGSVGLVVTLEYDAPIEPPPHSVPEPELRRLYDGAQVSPVDEGQFQNQKLRDAGTVAIERCYTLRL